MCHRPGDLHYTSGVSRTVGSVAISCNVVKIERTARIFTAHDNLDPVCVSIRPSFLFIDVSVIGPSETRYHTIVKICRQSGEFTGVDFSRL